MLGRLILKMLKLFEVRCSMFEVVGAFKSERCSAMGQFCPTSNLKPQTSNIQPPTSNLQPPTSNVPWLQLIPEILNSSRVFDKRPPPLFVISIIKVSCRLLHYT